MTNVNYYSMQQEAQRRVYEMQRRQRAAAGIAEPSASAAAKAEGGEDIPSDALLLLALLAILISDRSDPMAIALLLYLLV